MDDLSQQLGQMSKMGGMGVIMKMMPGIGKMAKQMEAAGIDDQRFKSNKAIISSMTRKERKTPKLTQRQPQEAHAAGLRFIRSRKSTSCSRCTARWPT